MSELGPGYDPCDLHKKIAERSKGANSQNDGLAKVHEHQEIQKDPRAKREGLSLKQGYPYRRPPRAAGSVAFLPLLARQS